MAEKKYIIFEADIKVDEAVAETARLKEEVTKLHFETEKLKRSEGETSDAYIKSKATLDNATKSLKQHENIVKTVVAQNNQNTEAVGKFDDVTKNATKRLREINVEMANMAAKGEQNTEKFRQLQQEGGHLRDSLDEVRARIKLYASDTRQLDQAIMVFQGIGAAAQIAEGASALLGTENEELTKSIQKMVAIQSVLNGLQKIQNLLQKESGLMILANSVKMKAMAAAQAIYTTAVGTSTGAMKVFRTALLATGIGAIIAGIAALVQNWDKLSAAIGVSSAQIERNNLLYQQRTELQKDIIRNNNLEVELMKARGATDKEINDFQVKSTQDRIIGLRNEISTIEKGYETYANMKKIRADYGDIKNAREKFLPDLQKSLDEEIEKYKKLSDDKTIIEVNNLYKGIEEAKKSSEAKIKLENDVKQAYLKSEQEFFNEVEKVRAEIVKRDLERIENYNEDIFAEFEDELDREAVLDAKKAQRLVERLNTDFENEMAILEMNEATKFKARKMWLDAQKAEELKKAKEIGADTQLINDKYRALDLELERAKIDAKLQLSTNFIGNIAKLFGEGTAIGKAAAITETIINTYKGAQAAYASLSSIPVVGPALGAAAAAAQIKVGFDNIKKIKAAGKGGGGGGASSATASAPIANAVAPTISSSAIAGQTATSTAQTTSNAVSGQIQSTVAVVVDDVTAKQNQQLANTKLSTV